MSKRNADQPWPEFDVKEMRIALESKPALAQKVAAFINCFALAELMTPELMGKITGSPHALCVTVLNSFRNYSSRLDVLQELLKSTINLTDEEKTATAVILKELKWLNTERNKYVHAQYATNHSNDDLRRESYLTDASRNTQTDILRMDDIESDLNRAKRLVGVMSINFGHGPLAPIIIE